MQFGVGEESLEIGLVRGACDHADLLALEIFRAHLGYHGVAPRHESRRRPIIRIGEVHPLAQFRRHRQRGDDGVAAVAGERVHQRLEAPHLDRAGDLDLLAQGARQIDIEAGRIAVGAGEVEGRIVGFGQKTDHGQAGQIGSVRASARVPEARHCLRRDGGGLRCRGRRRGLRARAVGRRAKNQEPAGDQQATQRHRAAARQSFVGGNGNMWLH